MLVTLFKTVTSGILPVERDKINKENKIRRIGISWSETGNLLVCFMIKWLRKEQEEQDQK